jgi:hypothetical protein
VASSVRPVPFWTDPHFKPLDLKCIGWFRTEDTDLMFHKIGATRSGSDGAEERGGRSHRGARFPVVGGEVAARWLTPAGFWTFPRLGNR